MAPTPPPAQTPPVPSDRQQTPPAPSDRQRILPDPSGIALVQAFRDQGLAWVQADLPVDVPEALPGERIRYRELGRGAHRARGELLEVLEPHPARIAPRCPLFHACGSCDRMHLQLEAQQQLKQARVADALEPFSLELEPLVPSPLAWGYRRRAKFTFFGRAGALELGAYRAGSHALLDLEACPVTDRAVLEARDRVRLELSARGLEPYLEATGEGVLRHLLLQADPATGAVSVVLVVARAAGIDWPAIGDALLEPARAPAGIAGVALNLQPARNNALTGPETRHLAGTPALRVQVGDRVLHLPAGAFSQVNLEVAGLIYRQAVAWAQPLPPGGALDLYCGVGALGLHLGAEVPWGIGIESHPAAVAAANAAAAAYGFDRWRFLAGDVDALLAGLETPGPVGLAIANPPRKGLGARAIDALLEHRPQRLLYVSCNPTTLAADLHRLTAGGYQPARARAFDMFPHTHHVETLVRLDRLSPAARETSPSASGA